MGAIRDAATTTHPADAGVAGASLDEVGAASVTHSSHGGRAGGEPLAGRYRIVSLLGSGGMGMVYKAHDLELDEAVALKVLRGDLGRATEGALARFRSEVRLARKVTHRNVARTFDIAEHRGVHFLTMEFIEGVSLAEHLVRVPRPPLSLVLGVVDDVTSGLAAAHAAGVVHRDLKPENVVLAVDGRAVLTDFGVALARVEGQVGVGAMVGTPLYMAPEQVEGLGCDGRADVYALGVMLYAMLTGEDAWGGEGPLQVAFARLSSPPPRVADRRPELVALSAVVARCMAHDRDERFATADEVRAAVFAAMAEAGVVGAQGARSMPPVGVSILPSSMGGASPSRAPSLDAGDEAWRAQTLAHGESAPIASRGVKTVAVLPLRNIGSPDDAYLAEGMTEDLVDVLTVTAGLRVASAGGVARWVREGHDAQRVGRELGVSAVVEGSVRRAGAMLRVSARIVSVTDGFQLWAERFDLPASEVLEVSDRVARAVAAALTLASGRVRPAVTNPEAVDLYLRARAAYRRDRPESVAMAVDLLERARALEPRDARITATLSLARTRAASLHFAGDEAEVDDALPLAEEAARLAPHLADPHVALGGVHVRQGAVRPALVAFRRALARAPDHAEACVSLGRALLEVGDPLEATRLLERGYGIDPTTRGVTRELTRAYALAGDWARCDEFLELTRSIEGSGFPYEVLRVRMASWRRDRAAVESLARHVVAPGEGRLVAMARRLAVVGAMGVARADDIALVVAIAHDMARKPRLFRVIAAQLGVEAMAGAGQVDVAVTTLRWAMGQGLSDRNWVEQCPLLVPLRGDERFEACRRTLHELADEAMRGMFDPLEPGG